MIKLWALFAAIGINLFINFGYGQTHVQEGDVSGTWTFNDSPYIIHGNITIPAGSTLTIEPGVEVVFKGNYRMTIKGVLLADGEENMPVTFTKNIPGPGWEGLRFEYANAGSQLIYCIIEYGNASGGFPNNVGGGTYIVGNAPVIENCIYRYNVGSFGGAIFSIAASPVIKKCLFYGNACGNYGGAMQLQGGLPKVFNCTFYDNSADAGAAINLENCDAEIQNSIFYMNDGYGAIYADAYSTDALVKHCNFSDNLNGDFLGYKPSDFGVIATQNYNGDPCDAYFNIFLDPVFTDVQSNDFTLKQYSPCIDAGNPLFPDDPDGTRTDLGPFWFNQELLSTQQIILQEGWSGISGFIDPATPAIDMLFAPILDDLIIMYSDEGIFWPAGGVNTLSEWNPLQGYIVKVEEATALSIEGNTLQNPMLSLNAGWNIIPVLTPCDLSVADLFGSNNAFIMIKEIAGTRLYWPEKEIFTLTELQTGKAYLAFLGSSCDVVFPDCDK